MRGWVLVLWHKSCIYKILNKKASIKAAEESGSLLILQSIIH